MIVTLLDRFGDGTVLMGAGLAVGALFGAAAQHSRFCLRAAAVEVTGGTLGPRLSIWLITFFAALACVQGGIAAGLLDVSQARQLSATGSLSGAIIGGLMFGAGMILARGCASRLLVLSATGNLRALLTGLVLTLVAQSALRGALAPAREALAGLWLIPGGAARSLLAHDGPDIAGAAGGGGRGAGGILRACAPARCPAEPRDCRLSRRAGRGARLGGDTCRLAGLVRDHPGVVGDLHRPVHRHADGAGEHQPRCRRASASGWCRACSPVPPPPRS